MERRTLERGPFDEPSPTGSVAGTPVQAAGAGSKPAAAPAPARTAEPLAAPEAPAAATWESLPPAEGAAEQGEAEPRRTVGSSGSSSGLDGSGAGLSAAQPALLARRPWRRGGWKGASGSAGQAAGARHASSSRPTARSAGCAAASTRERRSGPPPALAAPAPVPASPAGEPTAQLPAVPSSTSSPLPASAALRASCVILACEDPAQLEAAGESALAQTLPFEEVLVAEPDPEGRAGVLARLQHTLLVATGDIVFFLRSEDRYEPGHVERCLALFAAHPDLGLCDSAYWHFGRRAELVQRPAAAVAPRVQAALAGVRDPARLQVPALSALAVRRELLARALPFPDEVLADWQREAAEPLLRSAAAAGRLRAHTAEPTARVRVDDASHDHPARIGRARAFERRLALARLRRHLELRLGHARALPHLIAEEYRLLPCPTRADLAAYCELTLESGLPHASRAGVLGRLLAHHVLPRR